MVWKCKKCDIELKTLQLFRSHKEQCNVSIKEKKGTPKHNAAWLEAPQAARRAKDEEHEAAAEVAKVQRMEFVQNLNQRNEETAPAAPIAEAD